MLKREREWRPHWRERKSLRGNFEILHHIIPTAALLPDLPSYLPTYQSISHSYAHSQSPLIDSLTPLSFSPPIILSLSLMHTRSSLSMSLSPYHSLSSKPLSLSFSLFTHTHILSMSLYLIKLSCFLNFGCCTRYLGVRLTLKTEEMPFRLFHFFRLWPDVRIDACNERVTVV